jgi:hypothetical protein
MLVSYYACLDILTRGPEDHITGRRCRFMLTHPLFPFTLGTPYEYKYYLDGKRSDSWFICNSTCTYPCTRTCRKGTPCRDSWGRVGLSTYEYTPTLLRRQVKIMLRFRVPEREAQLRLVKLRILQRAAVRRVHIHYLYPYMCICTCTGR